MTSVKYLVYQSFETIGDPCGETFATRNAAEDSARSFSELIADNHFKWEGDTAVIPYSGRTGKTGNSADIEFWADLSSDSGATFDEETQEPSSGRMSRDELVQRILDEVIVIEELS